MGIWLALVVLDSTFLVYSLAYYWLAVVVGVVALVDVGVVDLALDFLAYLVADSFQRGDDLDVEKRLEGALPGQDCSLYSAINFALQNGRSGKVPLGIREYNT